MANKRLWLGMLVVALAFGMTVVGCGGEGEEEETDSPLTGTVSIGGISGGIVEVGQTLTANTNNLGGSGDISYQWKRNETTNIGTNSRTYTVQAADIDSTITVTVTRSRNSGSVTSEATDTILWPFLTGTVSIEITKGTVLFSAKAGDTLTANTDNLGGSGTISYQWKRNGTDIGTNSSTYTVQAGDTAPFYPYPETNPTYQTTPSIYVTVTRAENRGSVQGIPISISSQ